MTRPSHGADRTRALFKAAKKRTVSALPAPSISLASVIDGKVHALLQVKTVSEANSHEHWRMRQKRAKAQRGLARMVLEKACKAITPPCVVLLERLSARALDDDNLQGALKHVRDGVADALGINDRDPRVVWRYGQRTPNVRGVQSVEVTIGMVK